VGDVFFSPKKDLGLELQSVSGFANQKKKGALFLFKPHWRQNAYSGILIFDIEWYWCIRVFCWANIQQTSVMPGSTWHGWVTWPFRRVWDHNITLCFGEHMPFLFWQTWCRCNTDGKMFIVQTWFEITRYLFNLNRKYTSNHHYIQTNPGFVAMLYCLGCNGIC